MPRGFAFQDTVFSDRGFKVNTGSDAHMSLNSRFEARDLLCLGAHARRAEAEVVASTIAAAATADGVLSSGDEAQLVRRSAALVVRGVRDRTHQFVISRLVVAMARISWFGRLMSMMTIMVFFELETGIRCRNRWCCCDGRIADDVMVRGGSRSRVSPGSDGAYQAASGEDSGAQTDGVLARTRRGARCSVCIVAGPGRDAQILCQASLQAASGIAPGRVQIRAALAAAIRRFDCREGGRAWEMVCCGGNGGSWSDASAGLGRGTRALSSVAVAPAGWFSAAWWVEGPPVSRPSPSIVDGCSLCEAVSDWDLFMCILQVVVIGRSVNL